MIYIKLNAKKLNLPKDEITYTKKERLDYTKNGMIALIMPAIILVGITTGIFTPTEAAAVAVLYALVIGLIVFRNLKLKQLVSALWTASQNTSNLFLITSLSATFAWAIGVEKIPQQLSSMLLSITDNKYVMLFIMNIILLIVGMWMETSAAVLLFAPILGPIAVAMGIHPIHFAVIMILNLTLGLITPPVGVVLYAVSSVGREKFENVVKSCMPYIIMGFILIGVICFVPDIVLFIPRLLGFI
jgi:tripartite ATP-independent transporter DctM subunit